MLEINEHEEPEIGEVELSSSHTVKRDLSQTLRTRRTRTGTGLVGNSTPRPNNTVVSEVLDTVYRRVNVDADSCDGGESNSVDLQSTKTSQEKKKLILIMVGLPGRGKTYLCNKLMCYLNWCVPP
jgi:6-phosphofructo-2-kinase